MNRNKNFRRPKPTNADDVKPTYGTMSQAPKEGVIQTGLNVIAMKNLPRSTYAIKADPYTDANQVATTYPIIAPFAKKVNATYTGGANLSSGKLSSYSNSVASGFLSIFDVVTAMLKVNYKYLPINSDDTVRGKEMVDKMKLSISEALSQLEATEFMKLPIHMYVVDTDLPMGTDQGAGRPGHYTTLDNGLKRYTHPVDMFYAYLITYQTVLQNVATAFGAINKHRGYQGEMMRMSYERDTVVLNELFGQLNKSSFKAKLKSVATTIEGEYFDNQWVKQAGLTTNMVSRRSNGMIDPLLEVNGYHAIPHTLMRLKVEGEVVEEGVVWNSRMPVGTSNQTFEDVIKEFVTLCTLEDTLAWARRRTTSAAGDTAVERYNRYVRALDKMVTYLTAFKSSVADLRTALDKLAPTGVITWVKAYRPGLCADTNLQVFDNMIVNDIISSCICGADQVDYDFNTGRWQTTTLWNLYNGIPAHDANVGGAFLTFSTKVIPAASQTADSLGFLPILFRVEKPNAATDRGVLKALNRIGQEVEVDYSVVTVSTNTTLARLYPLASQAETKLRVPYALSVSGNATLSASAKGWFTRAMALVCGLGRYSKTETIEIDPDIIAGFDFQILDMTNDVINYCKSSGCFKGTEVVSYNLGYDVR